MKKFVLRSFFICGEHLEIFLQKISADTNFVPSKLNLCTHSTKLLQRLNLDDTKFLSADTFCRTISRQIHFNYYQILHYFRLAFIRH
ncbi:hypothetical protein BpHYR1_014019 [Brachionus plicatilis]|uniref:Uncharacterized protein n=1 Tax=Brachionus plicatilis TaxID=10195 RepID=A0A3M7PQF5_BRAPC|nr:hypothetical protein BpHYR1_014019 [Brachionus plicatilis]